MRAVFHLPHGIRLLLGAFVLSIWLTDGGRLGAEEDERGIQEVASRCEALTDLFLLQQAANELLARLDHVGTDAPLSSGDHKFAAMLADVYHKSARFTEAFRWAEKVQEYLDRQTLPPATFLEERRVIAALLGEIHFSRGEFDKAEQRLVELLDNYVGDQPTDAVPELDALVRLMEIAQIRGDEKKQVHQRRRAVEQKLGLFGSGIGDQIRQISTDEYARAARIQVRYYLGGNGQEKAVNVAVNVLEELLRLYPDEEDTLERAKIWSEIAACYRTAERYSKELDALRSSAQLHKHSRSTRNDSVVAEREIDLLVDEADVHRSMAITWQDLGNEDHAIRGYEKGLKLYDEALLRIHAMNEVKQRVTRVRGLSVREIQEGHSLIVLHKRLDVLERLAVLGRATTDKVIEEAKDLHRRAEDHLLENDPRIFRLKTFLGTQYLKQENFNQASSYLEKARKFWQRPDTPDHHDLLARSLNLLAEIKRLTGSAKEARDLLKRARDIWEPRRESDEELWLAIKINSGQLSTARGRYSEALRHFCDAHDDACELKKHVKSEARRKAYNDALVKALLHMAILYKSVEQYVEAEKFLHKAKEFFHPGQGLPPLDE